MAYQTTGGVGETQHTAKPILDSGGYQIKDQDLDLIAMAWEDLHDCLNKRRLLGMKYSDYADFVETLFRAARLDGIDEIDIRFKGSSATFFSGPHKQMPHTRNEVLVQYVDAFDKFPTKLELDRICNVIGSIWPTVPKPVRRYFDSHFALGLSSDRSDYDMQLSCHQITNALRRRSEELSQDFPLNQLISDKYGFYRKRLVEDICPNLAAWAMRQSEACGRAVTLATFDGSGPPEQPSGISSHFRESDWIATDERS